MTDFDPPARPRLPRPRRRRGRRQRRGRSPSGRTSCCPSRRSRAPSSATRARSTTAGRPGAAARPVTTGPSSGSARPGSWRGVVVDTAFFTGNYPPQASVDGAAVEGHCSVDELLKADWQPLLPLCRPGRRHRQRLRGGVRPPGHPRAAQHPPRRRRRPAARARHVAAGPPAPRRRTVRPRARWRTAAAVTGVSNEFYGRPQQLICRGLRARHGRGLGDRPPARRRQRLGGGPAGLRRASSPSPSSTPATSCGNAPGSASLDRAPGRDGEVVLLPAHPAAARHPAPLRPRRGRRRWSGCGSTCSPTAAWRGCGSGAGPPPPAGPRSDGAGSTRCPTSRRSRCSARSACRRRTPAGWWAPAR